MASTRTMNDREAAELLIGPDRLYDERFKPTTDFRSGADIAADLAAFFGLSHDRLAEISKRRALGLIGYDRSIVDGLVKKLHNVVRLGDYTEPHKTRRGAYFDVKVTPDDRPGWGERVMRVTVEMVPAEDVPL